MTKERQGPEKSHCEQQETPGGDENVGFGGERGSRRLSCAFPAALVLLPRVVDKQWQGWPLPDH